MEERRPIKTRSTPRAASAPRRGSRARARRRHYWTQNDPSTPRATTRRRLKF